MERPAEERPRSEPSQGNPAARDRREACGNVSMMGAGLRPHGKPWDEPPYPKMHRAPHFYPDPNHGSVNSQTWRAGHDPSRRGPSDLASGVLQITPEEADERGSVASIRV